MHRGLLIVVMDHPEDAQRQLEQRALRNVRALIDKLEGDERAKVGVGRVFASSIGLSVALLAIFFAVAGLLVMFKPARVNPKQPLAVTQDQRFAIDPYVNQAVLKIERAAAANYSATLKELEGQVRLSIAIRSDGSQDTIVTKSSGNPILDAAAEQFVAIAAPFPSFPKQGFANLNSVYITRTVTFVKGGVRPELELK